MENILEKTNVKTEKQKKFKLLNFTLLILGGMIVSSFSNLLGLACYIGAGVYTTKRLILPLAKKIKQKISSIKEEKKIVSFLENSKNKILNFIKEKKNNKIEPIKENENNIVEATKEEDNETKENEKSTSFIKKLRVNTIDKFKKMFSVKRDVNGCKIVNGEYRFTKSEIIQDEIIFKNYSTTNETEICHEKTFVKQK